MRAFRDFLKLGQTRKKSFTQLPRRKLSISIQGNLVSREDPFRYTNGRFLADEDTQLSKRYHVSKIEKMEGGFSKALLMTTVDGSEYIVKIPCSSAGRPMYCTASEVAVLNFVRAHTTMPVPKVFAWSADSTNPVGAEYIVMERIPGIQIFKKWDEMGESNRISLIKRITQWERELSEIQFPASGSLYYKSSLKDEERIPLDPVVDPEGAFCAGPSCDLAWSVKRDHPSIYCGPWKTISEMGISLVERSLSNSMDHPNPKLPASLNGPAEERSAILKMAKETIPAVANNPKLLEQSQPTLWHTDLHMGNIFVAEVDPGEVTGFIDWQHCSISRLFLQARWPVFVSLPEDYQKGLVMPQLPPDFEDMDDEEKEIALYNKAKATWTKAYEVATFLNNKKAWKAMQVPLLFKDIFRRCGETWDEGILPLREVLIELFLSQADLGFRERALSLNFTEEQIAQYAKEFEIYEEWHGLHKFVKEMLDTDNDGWISSNRDLNEVRTRNKMLFDYYISKPGISKRSDEIQRMWPFALDI